MKKKNFFESEELERKLRSEAQQSVRKMVQDLAEDDLSLEWRSQLNEKLIATTPRPVSRFALIWKPAMGLAMCVLLGTVVILNPNHSASPVRTGTFEAALVDAHLQNAELSDVAGSGLSPYEVMNGHTQAAVASEWDTIDPDNF